MTVIDSRRFQCDRRFGHIRHGAIGLCSAVMLGWLLIAAPMSHAADTNTQAGSNQVTNGLFTHGDQQFRVVSAADFKTAADVGATQPGDISQVVFGSQCQSCGNHCGGTCGEISACGSCGTACGGACGDYGACNSCGMSCGGACRNQFINPCGPCRSYTYVLAEALYMELDDKQPFTLSANFLIPEFDYEWAGRATVGYVPDCVQGWELSFAGRFQWDAFASLSDAGGGINTLITPGTGFGAGNFSAFNNATFQSQAFEAEYMSVEVSQVCAGWDIIKLISGIRYIEYNERFAYFSQTATETGFLASEIDNQLIGYQVGMDLLYPIRVNTYADMRARGGAYANLADSGVQINNAGTFQIAATDDRTDLAGVFELGAGLRHRFSDAFALRGGVEIWYLTGVGEASSQFSTVVSTNTGRRTQLSNDVFIMGGSFGAEFKY